MTQAPGRLTLHGIEAFLAVAETGSISAAANRLGSSVSGVSQHLAALEAAMGETLIDRSKRPATVTPAGQLFARRARIIQEQAALARAELSNHDFSGLGNLRIGVIEDFDADVTPRLLAGLAEDLPTCQFLLETGASHHLVNLLDTRALDIIVSAELGAAADWMEVHKLLREPFIAAVPCALANSGDTGLDHLRDLPLIQYTQRHHMGRQIADHLSRQRLTLAHRFELDSYHAIMAMVARGAGWTILTPLGYLRAQRFQKDVAVIPLPFEPLSRTISLSARRGDLQDMPAHVADRMRDDLAELIVNPVVAQMPWLKDQLQLL